MYVEMCMFTSAVCYLDRSASWLVYGNLLCISCDGSFEQPVWAVVEKVDHEQRLVPFFNLLPAQTAQE